MLRKAFEALLCTADVHVTGPETKDSYNGIAVESQADDP